MVSAYNAGVGVGFLYGINSKYRILIDAGGISFSSGKQKLKGSETNTKINSFNVDFKLSSFSLGLERKF